MASYFAWFGLPGTFVLTLLLSAYALLLALFRPKKQRFCCFAAMALSSIGDIFLMRFGDLDEIFPNYFVIGAAFFMLAHILYFITYRIPAKQKGYRLVNPGFIAALILAAACVIYFTAVCAKRQDFTMYPLAMIYLCIIIAACAAVLSYTWAHFRKNPLVLAALLGALSFFASDFIIGLSHMAAVTQFDHLIWWFYPIGQFLLITGAE